MARRIINIGSSVNKGDGDALRFAFDKVNDNFEELYTADSNTNAETLSYTPTTSSDWSSPAPTTTAEALDRLAVVIKALNGGTGA